MTTSATSASETLAFPRLPLPSLSDRRPATSAHFVISTIDKQGRVADRSPIGKLGWTPGQTVAIAARPDCLIVTPQAGTDIAITARGHLRIPASIRHTWRLSISDRLLIAAFPKRDHLELFGMSTLAEMVRRHCDTHPMTSLP